jgi:hypothetical protein
MKGVGDQDRGVGRGGGCEPDTQRRPRRVVCREACEQKRVVEERRFIVGVGREMLDGGLIPLRRHWYEQNRKQVR